jgi:two-component system NtrC family sensor kinase
LFRISIFVIMSFMEKESIIHLLEARMKPYHLPLMPVIWGVTFLIIGGLVAIGFYGYYSTEKAVANQFNTQQLMLAQQAARGIENFLADLRETTRLLAQIPGVLSPQEEMGEGRLRILYERFGGKVNFLFLGDRRGILTSAYPPSMRKGMMGIDFSSQPFFQKARRTGKPVIYNGVLAEGDRIPGRHQSFRSIWIAAPIFRKGEFFGVLGCGLDMGKINERYVNPIRSGVPGGAWVINQEGKFIAHYDPELLGKDAFGDLKVRDPRPSSESTERIVIKEMLQGKPGMNEYTSDWPGGKHGQVKKLIAYVPVRIGDQIWSIAVVAPYSDVTRVVWKSFKNSILLLAIMACTLLTGTYVGHKINQGRIRAEEKVKWGEEIAKSQNRLQALFDGAPEAISIVDRDYCISMLNKTGLSWYKRSLEEFTGKACYQAFQGRTDRCPNCPAEESFRTGKPAFRERASLVADGTKHSLQVFTFPLRDRIGEVVEVVEYTKDVTAERILQQQMIQSERLAVVGRMSANVAHEIKNPLGTIILNAELLEEELGRMKAENTAEARSLLGVIKSELEHLIDVVDEYLQFARLPEVKLENGNVNEVISDLLFFLKEEASERNVMVVEELETSLPTVQLDAKQFRQALLNILKNSFEAMPEGGKLTISTGLRDGQVEVTIADTGRGVAEENLELVFTPFFSTKHGGTGLGLPITTHIVREHRGTVSLQSYLSLGTVFTIRLPALLRGSADRGKERDRKNGQPADC